MALSNNPEVVSGVFTLVERKHHSVLGGVGVWNISHLECQFHGSLTMVPSQLHKDLVLRNETPVPSQQTRTERGTEYLKSPYLKYLIIVFFMYDLYTAIII